MVEMLIMAASHTSQDPVKDASLFKAGDVVTAQVDGWNWGREELMNPLFMILKVPDLPLIQAQALCATEPGDMRVSPMLQMRQFKINISMLPANASSNIDGVSRKVDSVTLRASDINAAKVQKPPLANPLVIG